MLLKDFEHFRHSFIFLQKGPPKKKLGLYQPSQAAGALAGPREIICSDLDRERFRLADPYECLLYMCS